METGEVRIKWSFKCGCGENDGVYSSSTWFRNWKRGESRNLLNVFLPNCLYCIEFLHYSYFFSLHRPCFESPGNFTILQILFSHQITDDVENCVWKFHDNVLPSSISSLLSSKKRFIHSRKLPIQYRFKGILWCRHCCHDATVFFLGKSISSSLFFPSSYSTSSDFYFPKLYFYR